MKLINFSVTFLTAIAISQRLEESSDSTSGNSDNKTFSVSIISGDPTESMSSTIRPSPTTVNKPTTKEPEKPSTTSVPETSPPSKTEEPATTTKKATTTTTTEAPWTTPPPVATFGPNDGVQTLIPSMISMGLVYLGVTYLTGMI